MDGELTVRQEKAIARLQQAKSHENDIAIVAGLERIFGAPVRVNFSARFSDADVMRVADGVHRPRNVTQAAIYAATAALRLSLVPDTMKSLTDALRALKSVTAHKAENPKHEVTAIALMAKELQKHPADVTRDVLSRSRHWFPTLHELHSECDALSQPRRAMLRAIEKWEPWSEADEDEWRKDRIAALKAIIHDCEKRHLAPGQSERKAEAESELKELKELEELEGENL